MIYLFEKLPPEPRSQKAAREFLRTVLARRIPDAAMEDLELIASELVANSVRHAGTDIELRVRQDESELRIEVIDAVPDLLPEVHPLDEVSETGRGLHLLQTLSSGWGFDVGPERKTVWSTLDLRDR